MRKPQYKVCPRCEFYRPMAAYDPPKRSCIKCRQGDFRAAQDEYLSPWSMRLAGFVSRVQLTEQAVVNAIHRARKLAPINDRKDY